MRGKKQDVWDFGGKLWRTSSDNVVALGIWHVWFVDT
jgi:hypothetical protein